MKLSQFLTSDGYYLVNRKLIKLIGLVEANVISILISKYDYHCDRNETLDIDGKPYFFFTSEQLQNDLGLSYSQQKRILANLKKAGLIDYKLKGLPAKLYYTIDEIAVMQLLDVSIEKSQILVVEKSENIINNNITNNKLLRKNIQKEKFVDEKLIKESEDFTNWFIKTRQNELGKKYDKPEKSKETYIDLRTKHKLTLTQIKELCEFALTNEFWSKTLLVPQKLVKKSKDGIYFYDLIMSQMNKANKLQEYR